MPLVLNVVGDFLMTFSNSCLRVVKCCFMYHKAALKLRLSLVELSLHLVVQKSLCFPDLGLHVRAHVLDPEVHLRGSRLELLDVPPCCLV